MKTDRELMELAALAKKATRGPWEAHECLVYFPDLQGGFSLRDCPEPAENAQYIAAVSPDVVTALIDRVRELEGVIDDLIRDHNSPLDAATTTYFWNQARAALNKE